MSILKQIKGSKLSKQGRTSLTGVFEGTPQNVAVDERGVQVPVTSRAITPSENPVDITTNSVAQPTYLTFLRSSPIR